MGKVFALLKMRIFVDVDYVNDKSYFLPCQHCAHECSIDARSCPNCGSISPFGIYSKMKLFILFVLSFCLFGAYSFWLTQSANLHFASDSVIRELLFGFGFLLLLLIFLPIYLVQDRTTLLQHAAKVKIQHPNKFLKFWK
jgi:hypothetical protein